MRPMRPITATYRLQFHKDFRFEDARAIVDYLDELGISHAYASPYLMAEPGSTHGYNMVDPHRLNPEVGTEDEHRAWTDALADREMGHILDVVPNHMAASTHNPWWRDVLENGPSSLYGDYFDIDWKPLKAALENKILLATLGGQYGDVLERGELKLVRDRGEFFIQYYDKRFPANPRPMWEVLERSLSRLGLAEDDERTTELHSIVTGLKNLPMRTETDPPHRKERAREKEILKKRLATLTEDPLVAKAIDEEITATNGTPGEPQSFDLLDALLMQQNYRLAYWRVASEEINYRRFFDVNDLAAIRMEDPRVFEDTHPLILRLVGEGRIQGVRLDHTDGLYDPEEYFGKLRRALSTAGPGSGRDGFLVAEKILSGGEELPTHWPIEGTTGYEALAQISGVFVDRAAEKAFTQFHADFTGDARSFGDHTRDSKRSTMRFSLSSEIHMLARRFERVAMRDRRSRDFTLPTLHRAIAETIAAFPVYRTYIRPDGSREPNDEQIVRRATLLAQRRNPEIDSSVFAFLRDLLLLAGEPVDDADRDERVELAMRFQQITGPVMAKSVEDTAFYTYVRFVALNEVGGAPERFGTSIGDLHSANALRRQKWSRSMVATSTHDTKRGEDVRARLAVLSELPETWALWVAEWQELAHQHLTTVEDLGAMPSAVDQYLFYQTVLGAYPLDEAATGEDFTNRVVAYAEKAAREAKQNTSWLSPNEGYETALKAFVSGMLGDPAFRKSLSDKVDILATHGASNSLAQVVLRIAAPGIPDTYQGSEFWDLTLVDPDNRRPVDYAARRAALIGLEGTSAPALRDAYRDGRVKLHVLRASLRLRREMPRTFIEGDYTSLDAGEDIVAFARQHESGTVVAAVTRRPHRVTGGTTPWAVGKAWGDHTVPVARGTWRDVFTSATHVVTDTGLAAATLFAELPVALLVSVA